VLLSGAIEAKYDVLIAAALLNEHSIAGYNAEHLPSRFLGDSRRHQLA
jgi:hypothetical protein